jgi:hypothetical protein
LRRAASAARRAAPMFEDIELVRTWCACHRPRTIGSPSSPARTGRHGSRSRPAARTTPRSSGGGSRSSPHSPSRGTGCWGDTPCRCGRAPRTRRCRCPPAAPRTCCRPSARCRRSHRAASTRCDPMRSPRPQLSGDHRAELRAPHAHGVRGALLWTGPVPHAGLGGGGMAARGVEHYKIRRSAFTIAEMIAAMSVSARISFESLLRLRLRALRAPRAL